MPQKRFYTNSDLAKAQTISLVDDEHHHLKVVMRVKEGELVELVNGKGYLAKAQVETCSKKETLLKIVDSSHFEIPRKITLALALTKTQKLDFAIEKCTELGIYSFCLFDSINSEKKGLSLQQEKRLKNITISALKQSGRLYLPTIKYYKNIDDVLNISENIFVCDFEPKAKSIKTILNTTDALIVIGPEKGFHSSEKNTFQQAKAQIIKLHQNILRAETAAIAASAYLSLN